MIMTTMSFSLDDATAKRVKQIAREQDKSQSDVFRDMFAAYDFKTFFRQFQEDSRQMFIDLGLKTEEDIFEYLESDDTYEDRIRQQHLLGSN
jgi:predicted transcriptional regulator